MASFYQLLMFLLIFVIETCLFFVKGYFLSIEFTLYPYLTSQGFLPYKNILDQHFPSLFFGTFSIPLLSQSSPVPLTFLFLSIIFLTNLFLWLYLKRKKTNFHLLWVFCYSLIYFYFSGNILWVETFVVLLLSIYLYLSSYKNNYSDMVGGLLLSQVILMRPNIAFALLFLVIYLKKINLSTIIGGLIGLLASFGYLYFNNIIENFVSLAITFNKSVYATHLLIRPSFMQAGIVLLLIAISILGTWTRKKVLILVCLMGSLILIYPRFGFEHLQPFILFLVVALVQDNTFSKQKIFLILVIFLSLNLVSAARHRYGNYFYQPEILRIGNEIKNSDVDFLYLFGASDLIYPLSSKVPPGKIYIPSLPWYLNHTPYQSLLKNSLSQKNTLIVVDTLFEVDGVKLIDSSKSVFEYIKMNFELTKQDGRFQYYTNKK